MISIEARFAKALAELKKVSASKFNTVFDECQKISGIEAKLNCVEAALKVVKESAPSLGLVDIEEAKRDFAVLFGVERKQKTATTKETAQPIKKHAGASEMFVEGSPFNGDRGNATITETTNKDVCAKGDKVLFDGLLKTGNITESEHKKLTGAKPAGYDKLTEAQRKEFDFARAIGISETDCFTLAKMAGNTFKEVSR